MATFFSTLLDIITYAAIGSLASYIYFYRKRKDLLGGFWGGAVIGLLGAVILAIVSGTWFIELMTWLMKAKKLFGGVHLRVNLVAALIGSFLFVYILNRINHDKSR